MCNPRVEGYRSRIRARTETNAIRLRCWSTLLSWGVKPQTYRNQPLDATPLVLLTCILLQPSSSVYFVGSCSSVVVQESLWGRVQCRGLYFILSDWSVGGRGQAPIKSIFIDCRPCYILIYWLTKAVCYCWWRIKGKGLRIFSSYLSCANVNPGALTNPRFLIVFFSFKLFFRVL